MAGPSMFLCTRSRLSTIVVLLVTSSFASATCYWQNSTLAPDDPYSVAPDDTACFPAQQNSPCCGTGWSCLSDGVCYINQDGNSFYYRGTCTDRTWNSQQCPGWCFAQNSNTSWPMAKCQKPSGEDWYCCSGDPDCDCDSGKDAVKLGGSSPSTITVIGSTSWPGIIPTTVPFTAQPLVSAGTSTDTSAAAASTSASSLQSSLTGLSSSTSPVATTSSGTAAPAGGSPSVTPSKSNVGLAAGLGAGLGVAAVLIAGLVFFLLRSRRKRRNTAATVSDKSNKIPNHEAAGYYEPVKHDHHAPGNGGYMAKTSELPADRFSRAEMEGHIAKPPTGSIQNRAELGP